MDISKITGLFDATNSKKIKIQALDKKYNRLKLTYKDIVESGQNRYEGDLDISFEFNFDMDSFLHIYNDMFPDAKKTPDSVIDDFENYFFILGKTIFSHNYHSIADIIHRKFGTIKGLEYGF